MEEAIGADEDGRARMESGHIRMADAQIRRDAAKAAQSEVDSGVPTGPSGSNPGSPLDELTVLMRQLEEERSQSRKKPQGPPLRRNPQKQENR